MVGIGWWDKKREGIFCIGFVVDFNSYRLEPGRIILENLLFLFYVIALIIALSSRIPLISPELRGDIKKMGFMVLFVEGGLIHTEECECVLSVFNRCVMGSDMWEILEPDKP